MLRECWSCYAPSLRFWNSLENVTGIEMNFWILNTCNTQQSRKVGSGNVVENRQREWFSRSTTIHETLRHQELHRISAVSSASVKANILEKAMPRAPLQ
jgi:hypothetical protein